MFFKFIFSVIDIKLLKFLAVGVVNTLFGAGIMFVMYNAFNFSYWTSSVCNYIFGGILSFFLNKFFTFSNNRKSVIQVFLFILNLFVCYFVAYVLAKKIVYIVLFEYELSFKDNVSMLCGMVLYTLLNYIGQRLFVFKDSKVEPKTDLNTEIKTSALENVKE